MGYIAVKGSQEAVEAARRLARPTGGAGTVAHVLDHLPLAVDEVQAEAGLYAPSLAATALTQARGDASEAAFLLRGYRSTLTRRPPVQAHTGELRPVRRISSAFRNVPGGQVLGATNDYGLRVLDLDLPARPDQLPGSAGRSAPDDPSAGHFAPDDPSAGHFAPDDPPAGRSAPDGVRLDSAARVHSPTPTRLPKVVDHLRSEGLVAPLSGAEPPAPQDITRVALRFPAGRSARLQALARGQSGAMTAFAYANLRGYGPFHPTLAELRVGTLPLRIAHPRTGNLVEIGELPVTEAETLGQKPNQEGGTIGVGYGCVLGRCERKAIAMAVLDAVMSGVDDDTPFDSPLADEEFVLAHVDPVEAAGFVEHLKLPHEVTFASDLDRVASIRDRRAEEAPR